ncbi:hypothetical protein L873DRAFT_1802598, partial [Choiromyces venosus 120613-1]
MAVLDTPPPAKNNIMSNPSNRYNGEKKTPRSIFPPSMSLRNAHNSQASSSYQRTRKYVGD